jgi:TonB family protein
MRKHIVILLIVMPTILFAQETKKVVDKETRETFYILKSDNQVKHGDYKKYNYGGKKVIISGNYKLGVKDGAWSYYNFSGSKLLYSGNYKQDVKDSVWSYFEQNGELHSQYDYTKKELIFYKPNEYETNKKYRIIVDGNSLDTTLSRPPFFLGGMNLLGHELEYPQNAVDSGISGTVLISFIVDKSGNVTSINAKTSIGYGLEEEAIRVIKFVYWLPGLLNGEPVDAEVIVPVQFWINR